MNISHELLLLMFNLSQICDRNRIIEIYPKAISEFFPPQIFKYSENNASVKAYAEEIKFINNSFGFIYSDLVPSDENKRLLQSVNQMLAVILDRLRIESILKKREHNFETIANKRISEIESYIKELETSNVDSVNLIDDLKLVITEREKAERARIRSEEKYSLLFNTMSEGVVLHEMVYDNKGKAKDYRITAINPAFEKHTGIQAKLAKNQLASRFYRIEPAPYLDIYSKVAETGQPFHFDTFFPPLNKHFDISVFSPQKGWFGTIFTDITEQKISQERNKENEKRFRSIIENTEAGYFFIDNKGIIKDINNAWIKLYKYNSSEEIIGNHFAAIQKIEDLEAAKTFVDGIMQGDNKFMEGEFSRRCKDGSIGYHSFSAKPVLKEGKAIGIEGFIIDITERRLAEEELTHYKKHLEDIVKTRTEELEITKTELETKNSELARFNKLFIGRELRIKELRDKITLLEETIHKEGEKR